MTDEHLQQLNIFLKIKDYSSAIKFLDAIKSKYAEDLDYLYFLVHINRKFARIDHAEQTGQKAILKFPDSSRLNFEIGLIYQIKGEYNKAIRYLLKASEAQEEDLSISARVDILNSIALTYKLNGDFSNTIKYYNLALDRLAQGIYENIKKEPLRGTDLNGMEFNYTGEEKEGWVDMATRVAIKNATTDEVRAVRFPTGETAQKIVQDSPVIGVAIYDDKDSNRYILPAYYSSFYIDLKSNIHYSNIYNNIGVLFSEADMRSEAKKCFEESIRFIPKGVEFENPFVGLKNLESDHDKKFYVVPQTEEENEENRNKIEELRAKGLLQKHEKTFKINEDGSITEDK